ncbi:MAG: dTDP-4-dehydrorhamnose reductase [Pontibacterium sp.]
MSHTDFSIPIKVLVAGASGEVGAALCAALGREEGMEVIPCTVKQLNVTDPASIRAAIDAHLPDFVVNCAAFNKVDLAEQSPELCLQVNAQGAENLARVCGDMHLPLIHMSSDFVFDGHYAGGYKEDDEVKPLGVYGQSKWLGEEAVRQCCPRHIILRLSWVFGPQGDNYVTRTLEQARTQLEIRAVNERMGCPTPSSDIARVILAIIRQLHCGADAWGTYHYSSAEVTSRYSFCKEIISQVVGYEQVATEVLTAVSADDVQTDVQRPASSVLICEKLLNTFGIRQLPWRGALTDVIRQIYAKR